MSNLNVRGVVVAVGEPYLATLKICLPRNMKHLSECVVVTSPEDDAIADFAGSVPRVRVVRSNVYRLHRAVFNKGYMVETGLNALGKVGWIAIIDADILFPPDFALDRLVPRNIWSARRRMLLDVADWREDLDWTTLRQQPDSGTGYLQIFHAEDLESLSSHEPWYDVTFAHAASSDVRFLQRWGFNQRRELPTDVLHIGPPDRFWFGTDANGQAMMDAYVARRDWDMSRRPDVKRDGAPGVGEIPDRVRVPGYPPPEGMHWRDDLIRVGPRVWRARMAPSPKRPNQGRRP